MFARSHSTAAPSLRLSRRALIAAATAAAALALMMPAGPVRAAPPLHAGA